MENVPGGNVFVLNSWSPRRLISRGDLLITAAAGLFAETVQRSWLDSVRKFATDLAWTSYLHDMNILASPQIPKYTTGYFWHMTFWCSHSKILISYWADISTSLWQTATTTPFWTKGLIIFYNCKSKNNLDICAPYEFLSCLSNSFNISPKKKIFYPSQHLKTAVYKCCLDVTFLFCWWSFSKGSELITLWIKPD